VALDGQQDPPRPAPEQSGDVLTSQDWSKGVDMGSAGSVRNAVSNAMVALKKRYYGKGPENARTYLNDNYVFCVLEGGLTRNEQTLLEDGKQDLVRNYRLAFQEAMTGPTTDAVEQITGRKVIGYHSQIVFDPMHGFEIFVLDSPPASSGS
jgi:uncharacterized protein YbcI